MPDSKSFFFVVVLLDVKVLTWIFGVGSGLSFGSLMLGVL